MTKTEQKLRKELRETRAVLARMTSIALKHDERIKWRGVRRWRKAVAHVVNAIFAEFGLTPDAPFDPRFKGMTAEQVYATLELEDKVVRKGPWMSWGRS